MKIVQVIFSLLAGFAAGAPLLTLDLRHSTTIGLVENQYYISGCRDIIFFWARGSIEPGNMGNSSGPPTAQGLVDTYGPSRVAIQGINYGALLITNLNPGGADYFGILELEADLESAVSKCPNSIIVVGGYSQGAALVHGAIKARSQAVKDKIVAVVTYGDTRNKQDDYQIQNFPKEKVLIICNPGDEVCNGTLNIQPPHTEYVKRVPEAVAFLTGKINAAVENKIA